MANRTIRAVHEPNGVAHAGRGREHDLEPIRTAVQGLRFGEVRIIIQDGVIVQIERVEKQRLR